MKMSTSRPSKRHALITGGGTGIGLAIARELKSNGTRVTVCGRNLDRLKEVADTYGFLPLEMDVTREESVKNATRIAEKTVGVINIHVANAGIAEGVGFASMDIGFWRKIMATNLDGAYLSIKYSLASMIKGDWGRIIAISSVAGIRGLKGASAYTASKHGMIGLIRALSEEYLYSGITANAVCPGYVETPIVDRNVTLISKNLNISPEEAHVRLSRLNRNKKMLQPEEVAKTVLWLCSKGSNNVNGQVIPIAGGQV